MVILWPIRGAGGRPEEATEAPMGVTRHKQILHMGLGHLDPVEVGVMRAQSER